MAVINQNDVYFILSGGSTNADPHSSLGGTPSEIVDGIINNGRLFSDVSTTDSTDGKIDYRCIYLINSSPDATLYETKIYIEEYIESGSSIYIGVDKSNERQVITINSNNTINETDSFDFSIETHSGTHTFNVVWGDGETFASNLKNSINSIEGIKDCSVSFVQSEVNSMYIFEINFSGTISKNRNYNRIQSISAPSNVNSVNIQTSNEGRPINSTAVEIETETTVPNGVEFIETTISSPLNMGNLQPTDIIPIWIKRVIPTGASPVESEQINIKILGKTINTN